MVTIVKGNNLRMITERKEISDISQSADGIVFQFIGGTHLYIVDVNMSQAIKEKIITTFFNFQNGDIFINLSEVDIRKVVSVTINAGSIN